MRLSREKISKLSHVIIDELVLHNEIDFIEDRNSIRLEIVKILTEELTKEEALEKEARRKIETLKSISKKYIANIDSLILVNEVLNFEKDSVVNVNKNINWKNYKLNKQNEKLVEAVNKGSVLSIDNMEVEAIKYRRNGNEVSTSNAKKTQKIRVCFSVLANPIAKSEVKIVYMQLIDYNTGKVITGNKNISVNISDNTVICTDSSEFNYKNVEMTHCFEWERTHILATGYYIINLIIDEKVALQSMLKLK